MMTDIWAESFTVPFGAVDRSDRLTLASTFDFFQEAAISHAEILGAGREVMAGRGQGWVLSRISVLMERRPWWREAITVRSWPRGWERLFAIRDYDIRDAKDKPIVRGRSSWLIVDISKRRPLRPQAIMDTLPLNEGLDALPGGGAALDRRDAFQKAGERQALYSDIDYNGHVNNVRYVQWIQDITGPETLERAGVIRLDLNYLNEIKPGESAGLWTMAIDQSPDISSPPSPFPVPLFSLAVEGRREGEQAAFRAELRTWGG